MDEEENFQNAFRCTQNLWEVNDVVRAHVLSKRYAGTLAQSQTVVKQVLTYTHCKQASLPNYSGAVMCGFTMILPSSRTVRVRVHRRLGTKMATTGKQTHCNLRADLNQRRPLETDKCITLWVPLIDCPLEMGPMSFVSGSHLTRNAEDLEISNASDEFIKNMIEEDNLTIAPAQHMKAGDATL